MVSPSCDKCPLQGKRKVEHVTVGSSPQLLLIGEAPGAEEERQGQPFVGKAGRLLREILGNAGISSYILTNAVMCRPDGNKNPSVKAIRACNDRLMSEIKTYRLPVVLLGKIAFNAVFSKLKYSSYRGAVGEIPDTDIAVIPTWHPAAALHKRTPEIADVMEDQIANFMSRVVLGSSPVDSAGFKEWISNNCVVDVETCNGKILVTGTYGSPSPSSNLWGHNIKYDMRVSDELPSHAEVRDTMIAFNILHPNYPVSDLKTLSSVYHLKPYTFEDIAVREKLMNGEVPDVPSLLAYNEKDLWNCARIAHRQEEVLKHMPKERELFERTCRLIPILVGMEKRGISTDTEFLQSWLDKTNRVLEDIGKERKELVRSPKKLMEHLGVSSTSRSSLETLKDNPKYDTKLVSDVITYRKYLKVKGVIENLLANSVDGAVHPDFIITKTYGEDEHEYGTVTGRLSCRNPNVQNIARDDSSPVSLRDAFVARKGCKFVELDFSQIELRVLAWLSQDPVMLDIYRQGGDIHEETREFLGIDRPLAKIINFGIVYGITPAGIVKNARQAGVSIPADTAHELIQKWYSRFKGIKHYHAKCIEEAARRGYFTTPLGRRRYISLYGREHEREVRKLINFPVQSTASDLVLLYGMLTAYNEILRYAPQDKYHAILTIHDSIVFEVDKSSVLAITPLLKTALASGVEEGMYSCSELPHRPPIEVSAKVGDTLGSMKAID